MLVTREWVAQKYTEFNHKFFGDKLPQFSDVDFKITMKKKWWGAAGYEKWKKNPRTGEYYAYGAILEMSNYYDSEEWVKENTLAHEMVHLYEFFVEPYYVLQKLRTGHYSKEYPRDGHGLIFYREAARLKQYGFNIARFVSDDKKKASTLNAKIQKKIDRKLEKGITFLVAQLSEPALSRQGNSCSVIYIPVTSRSYKGRLRMLLGLQNCKVSTIDEYVSHDNKADIKMPGAGRFYMARDLEALLAKYPLELVKNLKNEESGGEGIIAGVENIRKFLDDHSHDIAVYLTDYILKKGKQKYNDYRGYLIPKFTAKIKIDGQEFSLKVNHGYTGIAASSGIIYIDLSEGFWGSTAEAISYADDNDNEYQNAVEKVEGDFRVSINLPREKEVPTKPQLFRINTSKGTVEIQYTDDNDLSAKLKERFPKLSNEAIKKLMDNPANRINNEDVNFFGQIVTEVLDSLQKNDSLGMGSEEIEKLPDELPGMMVFN